MTSSDTVPATTLDELVDLLTLAPAGPDVWTARHSRLAVATRHVFGGLVLAQATVAAAGTVVESRAMHSLHAYFLRAGDPDVPLTLRVERTRNGRAFSHRRVVAEQAGRVVMELTCSFTSPTPGIAHATPAPAAPPPGSLRPDWEVLAPLPGTVGPGTVPSAFDQRSVGTPSRVARDRGEVADRSLLWFRADAARPLPDDPVLHRALLTYATDLMVLDATTRPHALSMLAGDLVPTTLDHAVWFHAPLRADEWWLHEVDSPWAGDGRAMARGRIWDTSGRLVAEVAQEGLLREP
ncbi:acyl-CoA thioesterase [Nocardioides abyssi]|uniref:Thioesterase family protein n=1 Tax=Nocardioides abyssi TaxID=3058370 RepID=A0ABT8EZ42_9ACTN|nr:acyl-CoA thioesterase domain-containing protein [Nocardioides abyssi]MDN4163455.1 thioesterase family protein [Nocardioides abyssi]